jgi:hypothetical protein
MARGPILPGTVTVTLDGSGNGIARIGPAGAREVWNAENASVHASSSVKEAQCKIFVGTDATASNYVDGTLSGSTGDSTDRVSAYPIPYGQYIWAQWIGGDAGAVAYLKVTGMREI